MDFEYDEKLAFHIRSFHSSILRAGVNSPSAERFTFPLDPAEPQNKDKCGPPKQVRWAESGGWCYERL
jgi:hypothetical protein